MMQSALDMSYTLAV